MVHEAHMHENNCFLTLTYNDENLPLDKSIDLVHIQKFIKRLRKKFVTNKQTQIRYFQCGEYGEQFARPHYHICLFNFIFPDETFYKYSNEIPLYTSQILEKIWGMGFCTIGKLTFESAAYCARYVTKKITGKNAEKHYEFIDPETGEIFYPDPEFATMSKVPGLGSTYLTKYQADIYPHDYVIFRGKKMKPPKAYDREFEKK